MEPVSTVKANNAFDEVVMNTQQASRETQLHQSLEKSIEEVKAGKVVDGPDFMASLKQQYFNTDI